ncbi:hypothetical protein AJ85_17035 [Alkalihalobacillus alcalophilus ATCC 27647 = CGMCC 1.3604]|uniref:Uncharacterized protein n=1 Tax=Alkalihalobacillus alcalophilus ATCC 27647 = CGMCC 1.3604 TaxID=1218173 RepID=A0A094WHJ2_ALKAL|nr:hypothetical protein [Alkalihalobacillus alcalophilus]KGA97234.1 hypothetical protein BALCAV_0211555 [Alkalihalobacillus alcalophilus ATCC 27647 = CGMCC 1.3604]MED1561522.1 hypothetical protein [Alkalihalobacillus alcalophilus]THG89531.1 hypothetical protein AJ85_17035 [Alkalihalobacillus alcalophilus ATCC 27647 = CGMCC 1.3604]
MNRKRLEEDFDKQILLLKGIRNEEKYVKDIENQLLYFTNAEVFRKIGRETKNDLFGDTLEGYYISPNKPKDNFLNINKGQDSGFDKEYLAKIYAWMKEVYICSFFYITLDEFENNTIPKSILNVFDNEFSGRKIAVFHGVQDLLDGLIREQGKEGYSWANYVHYQGIEEDPIFEEREYDEDPRIGYLLKRKGLYHNQREFRICYHKNCFSETFIKENKSGFNLYFGNIGKNGVPSVTVIDDVRSLKYLSIENK